MDLMPTEKTNFLIGKLVRPVYSGKESSPVKWKLTGGSEDQYPEGLSLLSLITDTAVQQNVPLPG
jgi:hypothetical protein